MLKIGLTGGIGSGKSEVSNFLQSWGAYIFDADKESKNIINNNLEAQKEIIKEFGSDVIDPNQTINRQKLARIAFQDEFHQQTLNAIIHPYVFKKINNSFEKIKIENNHNCFVVDAALIYESGADTHMDYVIVVSSLISHRTERVMSINNITREDFLKRVSLQWPEEDKVNMADYIIQNNSDLESLEKEAKKVFDTLL
ncbi:dephospho-CoA kinase [Candidatus Marinimicrobia bacterium]|nr:dephospho-CoA kinase [Candidatus Neomarinimicrobiota bacterium]